MKQLYRQSQPWKLAVREGCLVCSPSGLTGSQAVFFCTLTHSHAHSLTLQTLTECLKMWCTFSLKWEPGQWVLGGGTKTNKPIGALQGCECYNKHRREEKENHSACRICLSTTFTNLQTAVEVKKVLHSVYRGPFLWFILRGRT